MINPTVSILGCGWLGFPLAQELVSRGYVVKGATTQADKLAKLSEAEIVPFQVTCSPKIVGGKLESFFNAGALFLNIPFRRNLKNPEYYEQQIQSVVDQLERSPISKLVFASSTSVYPAHSELVRETDLFTPDTDRAKVLFGIEQMLLSSKNFETVILRFSGLYGGTRELGRFLTAGRLKTRSGLTPVNLVHLDDCVAVVSRVLELDLGNDILNVCSDAHPTRQELYSLKAKMLGLQIPEFDPHVPVGTKIVCNQKLKKRLNYQFIHPDPLE